MCQMKRFFDFTCLNVFAMSFMLEMNGILSIVHIFQSHTRTWRTIEMPLCLFPHSRSRSPHAANVRPQSVAVCVCVCDARNNKVMRNF